MFLKSLILSIVFLGLFGFGSVFAYTSSGVQRINPHSTLKRADKIGFAIPKEERSIKKKLQKLKKTNPKEFAAKLSQGIENTSQFQGYLLEIKEGLNEVEKAKKIAKYILYSKIEADWDIIKTGALNTRADKTFKTFTFKLKSDLSDLYYVKFEDGYVFNVGLWGYVTVSKNLKNIMWKIQFNSKYDNNRLEEGALDIQIKQDETPSQNNQEPVLEEIEQ